MHELVDWASGTPHPFTLSEELVQALKDKGIGSYSYVDRLPDSNFFAVSSCDGNHCQCISSGYFTVENGRAGAADGPKKRDDEKGQGCGVARWFGTIDGTPVAFQDDYDGFGVGPKLTPNLSAAPLGKGLLWPILHGRVQIRPPVQLAPARPSNARRAPRPARNCRSRSASN